MSTLTSACSTGSDILYEVFGRLSSEDVLAHVGSIHAPNDDLALVRARFLCGQRYKELCLAPTGSFIRAAATGDAVTVKEF